MKQGYEQVGVAVTCRNFDEYVRMFDLPDNELHAGEILDIAAGGSSFTADVRARGLKAAAVDPRYSMGPERLISEAKEEIAISTNKLEKLTDQLDLTYYGDISKHRAAREESLQRFAAHYRQEEAGASCYTVGSLPDLPFADKRFSLVLCSHFLFLYEEHFDFSFHMRSVLEMMRICSPGGSIRIYPLVSLKWEPYTQLQPLLEVIRENGGAAEFFATKLPFIPGSEHGLLIKV